MTEVRPLSDAAGTNKQYGLFATKAYAEGDVIFSESPLVASGEISSQFVDSAIDESNSTSSSSVVPPSKGTHSDANHLMMSCHCHC